MPIFTPHTSQVGIAVASGGRAASPVGRGAFMTPGQAALPGALEQFSRGLDKLGRAVGAIALERQNMTDRR